MLQFTRGSVMRPRIIGPLLLIISLVLAGCLGTGYKGYVDSFAAVPIQNGMTYTILPGNKNITADDLQFKEYAEYVSRALISKGMRPAEKIEEIDLAIFIEYGISTPQVTTSTRSMPVWGQTGTSSARTYGTLNSFGNYSATTYYTPQYGVTGYRQVTETETNYTRYLFIDAYDLQEYFRSKKDIQIWKVTVTSTDSRNDLREAIPFLVAGSMEHLGTSTGKKVEFNIGKHSEDLNLIKGVPSQ